MSRIETPPTAPENPAVTRAISRARELLSSWTVAQYLEWRARSAHPSPKLVTVDPGQPLGDILRVLAKHNILSAPVIERATGKFGGFVDVGEILGLFVSRASRWLEREHGTGYGHENPSLPQNRANETVGLYSGHLREEMYSAADDASVLEQLQSTLGEGMFTRTLRAARGDFPESDRGDGEGIFRGYAQASLLTIVSAAFMHPISEPRFLPSAAAGALASNHRVGVYDWDAAFDDGSRVSDVSQFEVISQSDLVRFLWDRRDDANVEAFVTLAVADAFLSDAAKKDFYTNPNASRASWRGKPKPSTRSRACTSSASLVWACATRRGRLVANVSASDLRGLTRERLETMASDVLEFVAGEPENASDARNETNARKRKPVTCLASETVRDVLERMVSRRVHHVYVCDDERKPVAMVTPNDVLRVLRMSRSRGEAENERETLVTRDVVKWFHPRATFRRSSHFSRLAPIFSRQIATARSPRSRTKHPRTARIARTRLGSWVRGSRDGGARHALRSRTPVNAQPPAVGRGVRRVNTPP
jgi:CBS domain-containing protein